MAKCGVETEVYSRVCGYCRPVRYWNRGKRAEFEDRKPYKIPACLGEAKAKAG